MEHFVWCAMENIMEFWCLRGYQEPSSLTVDDFEEGITQEGEYKGIEYIRLKETYNGQKNNDLSLKNAVVDAENTIKKTLPCIWNKHYLSCYQTTKTLIVMVPDKAITSDGIQRIFRKPAKKATIEKWILEGKPWRLNPNSSKVIGSHTINSILKSIAVLCKYDNPKRCTLHGKRRCGVSKITNGGASAAVSKMVCGHADLEMTAKYQKPDQAAFDQVTRTHHRSPTKIKKQLRIAKEGNRQQINTPEDCKQPASLQLLHPPSSSKYSATSKSPAFDIKPSPLLPLFPPSSSKSSAVAIGCLGMMTQRFEDESPPPMMEIFTGRAPPPLPPLNHAGYIVPHPSASATPIRNN